MSGKRDRIQEPPHARMAVLPALRRLRRAGTGRALTARGLPAVLAIGSLLPMAAGGSAAPHAPRHSTCATR
jgi:hypothetical protein